MCLLAWDKKCQRKDYVLESTTVKPRGIKTGLIWVVKIC